MKFYKMLILSGLFVLISLGTQAQNGVITISAKDCNFTVPQLISSHAEYESFKIISKDCTIKSIEVIIFSRWGQELYKSNDIHFEWSGLYKASKKKKAKEILAPAGTYLWQITVEFETGEEALKTTKKGYLQIIR